MEIGVSKDHSI